MNDDNFYAHIAEEQDKKQDIISALKKILNYLEKTGNEMASDESDNRPKEAGERFSDVAKKEVGEKDL